MSYIIEAEAQEGEREALLFFIKTQVLDFFFKKSEIKTRTLPIVFVYPIYI